MYRLGTVSRGRYLFRSKSYRMMFGYEDYLERRIYFAPKGACFFSQQHLQVLIVEVR
jgi:hypothetical protein